MPTSLISGPPCRDERWKMRGDAVAYPYVQKNNLFQVSWFKISGRNSRYCWKYWELSLYSRGSWLFISFHTHERYCKGKCVTVQNISNTIIKLTDDDSSYYYTRINEITRLITEPGAPSKKLSKKSRNWRESEPGHNIMYTAPNAWPKQIFEV